MRVASVGRRWAFVGLLAVGLLAGCGRAAVAFSPTAPGRPGATLTTAPQPTATTTATPSPTSPPVAARVNGQAILVAEWVAETRRAQQAAQDLGLQLPPEQVAQQTLEVLIERALLAQAAQQRGLFPNEAEVQARWEALQAARGGPEAWQAYLQSLGYTPEAYRQALAQAMAAARMRDAIAAAVPTHGPQVKARVIQVPTQAEAEAVLQYLQAGNEFLALVRQYHPGGLGDLGWFPRGALWVPEVEDAAFALQPGEHSAIVATDRGYFIVFVEDKAEDRPYAPWALRRLQARAVRDFVTQQRAAATVEILLEPQQLPAAVP